MAQKVRTHEVEFLHSPLAMGRESVIKGEVGFAKFRLFDDFDLDTINTDRWAESVGNGGVAMAIVAGANGLAAIAVNTGDNDCAEEYGPAIFSAAQNCTIECRLKVNAITTVAIACGFVNAASNTNDKIAFDCASDTITQAANVTDAVCFVFDTDATTDRWFMASTKNNGTAQGGVLAAGVVPVADTFEVLKIMLDSSGNAGFFRNGKCVGGIAAAITAATLVRPYFAIKGCATTGRTLTVDYVLAQQDRAESATVVW